MSVPPVGVETRGTVALLAGCVQDRWFHRVNLATIRVLTKTGWRVTVPRGQACCGALAAHNGRLGVARRLATRAKHAFRDADVVIVNAAGCSAHMRSYEELAPGTRLPVRDLVSFLHEKGLGDVTLGPVPETVAYHDACHALRAQGIRIEPRELLLVDPGPRAGSRSPTAIVVAAQPVSTPPPSRRWPVSSAERRPRIAATGATIVASANPGCSIQLATHLRASAHDASRPSGGACSTDTFGRSLARKRATRPSALRLAFMERATEGIAYRRCT